MKKKAVPEECVSGFLLMIFSLLMLRESLHQKHVLWPRIALSVILISSLILICGGFMKSAINRNTVVKADGGVNGTEKKKWLRVTSMAGLHFLYYIALHWVGFIIATPIFICGAMAILGEKNKIRITVVSFLTSVFFIVTFIYILRISPPKGVFLMRNISSLFY